MRGVVATLRVQPEQMWESLIRGFSQATDLAEFVMQTCEVDYRTAYYVVGAAVRDAARAGLRGVDVTGEMLDRAAQQRTGRTLGLGGRDLSEILNPRDIVLSRSAPGGAAPDEVRRMVASCRVAAEGIRDQARRRRQGYEAAEDRLVTLAQRLAPSP
jgi:argininosuccinate lyase